MSHRSSNALFWQFSSFFSVFVFLSLFLSFYSLHELVANYRWGRTHNYGELYAEGSSLYAEHWMLKRNTVANTIYNTNGIMYNIFMTAAIKFYRFSIMATIFILNRNVTYMQPPINSQIFDYLGYFGWFIRMVRLFECWFFILYVIFKLCIIISGDHHEPNA